MTFQPVITNWASDDQLITNGVLGRPGPVNGIGPVGGTRSSPIGTVEDVPGQYGRVSPWGAIATTTTNFLRGHIGTGTASAMLRIAQANITNWIGEGPSTGSGQGNNFNGAGGVPIA